MLSKRRTRTTEEQAMKPKLTLIGSLILLSCFGLPANAAMRSAKVSGGQLEGISKGAVSAFLGIPFAAPPTGDLRWRPPRPAAPWSGVLEADHFSRSCYQRDQTGGFGPWTTEFVIPGPVSEDCLYLNVWTPAESDQARLPVLFWIYGGGFDSGSGSVPLYDGTRLAGQGIVVVNANYRVNVFGFLAHPELTEESPHHASGNYGLLDQLAALRWVQENIAALGGDPNRVTIAGQSAGAASVQYLMSSPLAKGLFSAAIIQSGPGDALSTGATLQRGEQNGVAFLKSRGVDSIRKLRDLPADRFGIRPADPSGAPAMRFGPVIDGWFLPESPGQTLADGRQSDIPVLAGVAAEEASFGEHYGHLTVASFKEQARRRYGRFTDEFLKLYPVARDADADSVEKEATRDRYRVALRLWAEERSKTGRAKTFVYLWNHVEPGPNSDRYGSFHSSELAYVFDNLNVADRPFTTEDHRIAEAMSSYWVHFVKTSDPNGPGLVDWPAASSRDTVIMDLGDHFGTPPPADPAKVEFFQRYLASFEGRARGWLF
jgi:para-nitrobenzyl esterase